LNGVAVFKPTAECLLFVSFGKTAGANWVYVDVSVLDRLGNVPGRLRTISGLSFN
jgi:hypothetical protein